MSPSMSCGVPRSTRSGAGVVPSLVRTEPADTSITAARPAVRSSIATGGPSGSRSCGKVRELHASTTQLQWVVDAYNLVFAALLLTFGSLSDRLGRKGMLLAGLAVFGAASIAGVMALLVFTIIEAPTYGWGSARSVAGFALSAVLLAAFIAWEQHAAHPILDVRLFRNMRFSAASGAVTVSFFTLFGFIFLMTQYFQFIRGYGPLSTGVHLLPVALSVGVGSVAGTQLAVRAGTNWS